MVKYDAFKEMITAQILDYMPEEYAGYEVHITKVLKTNKELDGMQLVPPNNVHDEKQIIPVLYLNDSYEDYKQKGDMYEVLENMANSYKEGFKLLEGKDIKHFLLDDKSNITLQVINTDINRKLLNNVPHRDLCDLSVVYNYCVKIEPTRLATIRITDDMLNKMEMTENELYQLAYENTKKLMPFHCITQLESVGNMIREEYKAADVPDAIIDMMIERYATSAGIWNLPPEKEVYIISNDINIDGANALLYTDALDSLSEKFNSDLLIISANVNEIYAVSAREFSVMNLTAALREENRSDLNIKDQLSNQVYLYNRTDKTLKIASDDIVPLEKEAMDDELNEEREEHLDEQPQEKVNKKHKSR